MRGSSRAGVLEVGESALVFSRDQVEIAVAVDVAQRGCRVGAGIVPLIGLTPPSGVMNGGAFALARSGARPSNAMAGAELAPAARGTHAR